MTFRRHGSGSSRDVAEAAFKSANAKPVETVAPKPNVIPQGRELVSIRVDRDVLEHFQADGQGWQDRMNVALRKAAGLS